MLAYEFCQPAWDAVYPVVVVAALLAALLVVLLAVLHRVTQLELAVDRVFEAARCLMLQPQVSCAGRSMTCRPALLHAGGSWKQR